MAYHCWFQEKMCHNVWLTDIINFLLEFVVFWLVHSVLSMITLWTLNWRYMVNDFTGFRWVNFSFFLRKENISIERIWARLKATYSTWSIAPGRSTRWFVVADPSKKEDPSHWPWTKSPFNSFSNPDKPYAAFIISFLKSDKVTV